MSVSGSFSPMPTDQKRSVRFQLIDLIEIAIVLGDNPSLSTGGPPMSLGWDPVRRSEFDLDHYEKHRPKRKESRRELIISGNKRTKFFLRCGYSMTEIEEAAAMSLNYRNQMTITKLLDPPTAIKDAVKDRFASCHEPNVETQRHRISRRHSNELLHAPYREQASNPEDRDEKSRSKVSRRLSNFEPRSGLVRRLSTETLTAPVRATSPTKPTPRARRNSPTANPTASPTGLVEIHQTRQHYLPYQGPVQLPTRSYSPDKVSRGVKRYHSAPLATLQGLRKPVRSISPSSLSPEESETDVAARFKGLTMFDVPLCKGNNNNPSLPTRAGSLSPPVSPWLASLASSSQQRSPASLPVKPPRRQLSPPHSVHLQSK